MEIVKCLRCGLFSDHEGRKICPFCSEKIVEVKKVEVEEKPKDPSTPLGAGKKVAVKTRKGSFKIWGNS